MKRRNKYLEASFDYTNENSSSGIFEKKLKFLYKLAIFHQSNIFPLFDPNLRHHALYFSDNIDWVWRHPLVEKNLKKRPWQMGF